MKRESPLGGEDNSSKSDDLSNAPKLPPKPGKISKILNKFLKCVKNGTAPQHAKMDLNTKL